MPCIFRKTEDQEQQLPRLADCMAVLIKATNSINLYSINFRHGFLNPNQQKRTDGEWRYDVRGRDTSVG